MDLLEHLDRAVGDDAAVARKTTARGRQIAGAAGGVLAVLGLVAGLKLPSQTGPPAAMRPITAPSCSLDPAAGDGIEVVISLYADTTERQRSALTSALAADTRVDSVMVESGTYAYEEGREPRAESAELGALPDSYRLRLIDASGFRAFRSEYAAMDGVQEVIGRGCP
ncbi:permease-like cell division protein FtsX [Actinoplanes sp. Pm04-4]|uniref:Permease-like cell division protein FtsX n=1 Tax=Paractinoplanes pyxinae TaxID=2997416 RepID=A0ABT4BCJ0_9ACTN|nr:permease-like cell division protein FtsX [Actinoplanes pyxinae]MCY1143530.1 permease-like cell division protein FtsX [Actinoplanes pyxinae]